jgi:DNA-binding NtrC family response regulator
MGTFSVLLVDDEPGFLHPLAKRLIRRHLNVATAGSGREALRRITEEPFDVVVLDVKMPGMDGLQTLAAIKAESDQVEVILLSGHASLDAAIEGVQRGAFDYLLKPVDFDELFFKLQDACQKKRLREAREEMGKDRGDVAEAGPS